MLEELRARLEQEPVKVECPICRHRQWMGSLTGRCDQCGSEITVYSERSSAEEALNALVAAGRVAYLREIDQGVYAVIANRKFGASSSK